QDLLAVVDHSGYGQVPEADDVVLPPAPVGLLDVDQTQIHPVVGVDLSLTVGLPLHTCGPSRSVSRISDRSGDGRRFGPIHVSLTRWSRGPVVWLDSILLSGRV